MSKAIKSVASLPLGIGAAAKAFPQTVVGSGGGTIKTAAGQTDPTTVTTSTNIPLDIQQFQKDIFARARGTANQLGARQFADFSPLQQQGFSFLSGINQNAGIQGAQNALAGLQGMSFGAERIDPMMVSGTGYNATLANAGTLGNAERAAAQGYLNNVASSGVLADAAKMGAAAINRNDIRNVAAQNFLQGDIGAYQNPYTNQVINQSLADLDRARIMQQQGVNAQALSRGAFGGSRQAIAEAENNRNFLEQQARTSAGLRQQGFDTAAGLMQQDMARALQASLANQGVDFNTASQNASLQQQAAAANQAAQNQFALSRYGQEADISRFNAQNANAANQFYASAANAANLANQQAANQFALSRYGQEADISRFNAANQTAASQFGADAAMRATLANQAAGLTAAQQNANNQLQAQQLRAAALSNALTGGLDINRSFLGNIGAQMEGGGMQQALEQQRMDAIRNLPMERLGILSSTFTGGQLPYGQSQTSPVQKGNPFLGALGGAAAGGALFGAGGALAGVGGLSAATGAGLGALAGLAL